MNNLDTAHHQSRAVLWISDGIDNAPNASLADVLSIEENRRAPIYAIGIGDPNGKATGYNIAVGPFSLQDSATLNASMSIRSNNWLSSAEAAPG